MTKRCCQTCRHYFPKESVCYEGGYSEIEDPNKPLTEEDCSAWEKESDD